MPTKSIHITQNFHASFLELKNILAKRKVDLSKKHFVIVPDKCSIFVEGILFSDGGAFDIEVLSFERLELKFNKTNLKALSSVGAVMLIRQILFDVKKQLQVFKRSVEHKGLAQKLYESICAASDSGLTPSDLLVDTDGASGKKLADIALVWSEFLARTNGKFLDNSGKMQLLKQELEAADLKDKNIYITGFDRFTEIEKQIIELLAKKAASFINLEVAEPIAKFGQVEFYQGQELATRVKKIAQKIRLEFVNGLALPHDFCVIADDKEYSTIERIFSEYDIPLFIDKQLALHHTEAYKLLNACFNGISFRQEDILSLVNNYYIDIELEEKEIFTNYVLEHSINFNGFKDEFNKRESRGKEKDWRLVEEKTAEKVRQKIVEFLNEFNEKSSQIKTADDFYLFFKELFLKLDIENKTTKLGEFLNLELVQIVDKFLDTAKLLNDLNLAYSYFSPFKRLYRLFIEGVASIKVSLMPAFNSTVMAGSPSSFRGGKFKKVFVASFNEGLCPKLVGDTALISLGDIQTLKQKGKSFYPTPHQLNHYATNEIIRLFNLSDELFLAYSNSGDSRISSLERVVKSNAECTMQNAQLGILSTRYEALEFFKDIDDLQEKKALSALFKKDELDKLRPREMAASMPLVKAGELFFSGGTVSISRIQRYFNCPYKSFVESVLGLTERDTGEVKPLEVGSFLHKAVENFVETGGTFLNPQKQMLKVLQNLVDGDYKWLKEKSPPLLKRLNLESLRLATPIADTLTKGSFKNKFLEQDFGTNKKGSLKTIDINLSLITNHLSLALRGVIDRVDTTVLNNTPYARIIDYKSGGGVKTHGDIKKETYYGLSLQLPLYAKILELNGFKTAGVFYFLLSAGFSDEPKKRKLKGYFLHDENMWGLYDNDLKEYPSKSEIIDAVRNKKDGSLHGSWSKPYSKTQQELTAFSDYALKVAQKALTEIANGNIAPSPYKMAGKSPCDYCKANSFCGVREGAVRELGKVQLKIES